MGTNPQATSFEYEQAVDEWQSLRGTCSRCKKLLDAAAETGAHGDRYCPRCWRILKTEGEGR